MSNKFAIGNKLPSSGQIWDPSVNSYKTVTYAFLDPSASGDNQIVAAAGGGIKIRVLACSVIASAAVNIRFRSATNSITSLKTLSANAGFVYPFNENGWFQTNANEALNINLSGAIAVGVDVAYITIG